MDLYERLAETLLELATVDNSDVDYEIVKPFTTSKGSDYVQDLGGDYERGPETEETGDKDEGKEEGAGVTTKEPSGYGESVTHLMDRFRNKIQ